ncbi:hypothetical protein Ade02nite_19130 [Paractinoplanes deccanensis]|uniref:Uncharacterized protein n=1 Tax=Paractinoplanes deccanensis TaxID=113561 RepID=A0ABQ3XZW5_9ACTN|nr:hypothetical protein [Actinoplanes deccanensis]GID73272.1 hypothetical protein Ade02nite_19130 [Actinoplanes deccanensis]
MSAYPAFEAAERLAPEPEQHATADDWIRHYAALALAAWREFRTASGVDLGLLSLVGTTATSAAVALTFNRQMAPGVIWSLTPEAGALHGEWEEWLTETLDRLGVNPADIHPGYEASDFRSPSRAEVAG